jgi:hypothetical protein
MIYIIIGFIIAVGLEYYLAKRKNSWLGLILPVACLIATVIAVVLAPRDQTVNIFQQLAQMGYTLLYFNIPTLILVMIYLRFHKKK